MVRRWVRMVGGMKAWRREADFIIRRRAINRGRGITAGVYPLPGIFRDLESQISRSVGDAESANADALIRDLTRWTNARRKEAGRKTLPRLISEERSARAGARTISPLEGNSRHLASRLPRAPLAFLWSPTRSFASSFDELSSNQDWHAFERDGGTTRSGFNLPACIRHSSDILACEIAIRFDIGSRGTVRGTV